MINPVLVVVAAVVLDVATALIVAQLVALRVEKRLGAWITDEHESTLSDWVVVDDRLADLEIAVASDDPSAKMAELIELRQERVMAKIRGASS